MKAWTTLVSILSASQPETFHHWCTLRPAPLSPRLATTCSPTLQIQKMRAKQQPKETKNINVQKEEMSKAKEEWNLSRVMTSSRKCNEIMKACCVPSCLVFWKLLNRHDSPLSQVTGWRRTPPERSSIFTTVPCAQKKEFHRNDSNKNIPWTHGS